jgi:predicted peptidase
MSVYTRSIASALRMLRKYGQFMTLTQRTTGAYNPATATASVTESGQTVTGAVFDYPTKQIDGTLILRGDKQVIVAASGLTVTPAPGMKLTDVNGDVFEVIAAEALAPAGEAVIHTLQVRA